MLGCCARKKRGRKNVNPSAMMCRTPPSSSLHSRAWSKLHNDGSQPRHPSGRCSLFRCSSHPCRQQAHNSLAHTALLHDVAVPGHVVRLQNLEAILRSELGFLLLFLLGENLCRLVPVDNALHVARQIYGRKTALEKCARQLTSVSC